MEDRLRETARRRGFSLVAVVRTSGVPGSETGCPDLGRVLEAISGGQAAGVLTLADFSFAWDREIAAHAVRRIREVGGFVEYAYGPAPRLRDSRNEPGRSSPWVPPLPAPKGGTAAARCLAPHMAPGGRPLATADRCAETSTPAVWFPRHRSDDEPPTEPLGIRPGRALAGLACAGGQQP
ncbi:hypothetical protein [Carbonactinospora thermoautotrophica]|uniref:hypothetical protein n=1 Tax=Carbonactinospora thermoautotrophica TaxID=1469144 RepID=UPI00082C6CC3|nr:hypothetical protein [Carbonactinospora thermoautotrophica]